MGGLRQFLRGLFSSSSEADQSESRSDDTAPGPPATTDPESVLHGTADTQGVVARSDSLRQWKASYDEEYTDFLTMYEGLTKHDETTDALADLDPILSNPEAFDAAVVDAAETIRADLETVREFIENREAYNDAWLDQMKESYRSELNGYFDDPEAEHTDQQLRAIFANDNYNRVNAAAGTGKTTTFGRRVHFILSEFDDVSARDLLAFTFTRNGRDEMQTELEEKFDITGVDVRTINSYSKSVAEEQYDDLEFVVGEAKTTETARIWRAIRANDEFEAEVETFMQAWKAERYDPNDADVVDGVYEAKRNKSTETLQGEDVELDDVPEEAVAHKAIAAFLTRHQIEYDYQTHLDWASSPSGGYVLDFELVDPVDGERVYIEYCTSEAARNEREFYRNVHSERPETVHRIFDPNERQPYDADGKRVVVLDGETLLDRSADELQWDERTETRYRRTVQEALRSELGRLPMELPDRLAEAELKEYIYDRKILYHDVVDTVADFIGQARVREWDPAEAEEKAHEYLDAAGEELDEGVEEFVQLAVRAYREFDLSFDNRTKTDFHGSVVLARDLLREGAVDAEYLYSHVFVDEMQDLNQVQFSLVKELSKQRPDVRTFGVGDDWQSIFGFQGARPDLFINFGAELGAGTYPEVDADPWEVFTDENRHLAGYGDDDEGFRVFTDTRLEDNYRCPEPVVDASNRVIRNNEVRTEKDPTGSPGGQPIRIQHLGCDTFGNKLDESMMRTVQELVEASPYEPEETQVLLRQKEGDPTFYYPLKQALPDGVDIRTAHDSKGSEAEHVIIPKVIETGGYPSIQSDKWVEPVDHPPGVYADRDVSYQLEEERRLFYVALTRSKARLDVMTVQGAESVFIEELPDDRCEHRRPLPTDRLQELDESREIREDARGVVADRTSAGYASFDWADRGYVDLNLYDATDEQTAVIDDLVDSGEPVTLRNCGIQYRRANGDDSGDSQRPQLQLDDAVEIER